MCFEPGLSALAAEMQRCNVERYGIRLYGAPGHSVFDVLGSREVDLSQVLAHLFDPNGAHGQGALFLNEFLRVLDVGIVSRSDVVRVRTEVAVPVSDRETNRRIDILIEAKHFVIGIENKLFTGESLNQLCDYAAYLKRLAEGSNRQSRLVFISTDVPSDATVTSLPWLCAASQGANIDSILAATRGAIRAPKVGDFVDDLRGWIARTFGGISPVKGLEPFVDTMIDSLNHPEKAQAIGAAIVAKDAVQERLIAGIETRLRRALDGIDGNQTSAEARDKFQFGIARPELQNGSLRDALQVKWTAWCARRPSWPENCFLAVQSDSSECKAVSYGLLALDPLGDEVGRGKSSEWACAEIDSLNGAADTVRNRDSRSEWWPWSRYATQRDWSAEGMAVALVDGRGRIDDLIGIESMTSDLVELAKAIDARKTSGA